MYLPDGSIIGGVGCGLIILLLGDTIGPPGPSGLGDGCIEEEGELIPLGDCE